MGAERVILHLGTPKTGTTSLQNMLVAEEKSLANDGIRYLRSNRASINHNRLMMKLSKGDTEARKATESLRRELDETPEPVHLLSTEIAYGPKPTRLLLDAIGEEHLKKAEIIIYFRRQDLLLEAMAKQKLKSGHYQGSLEDFIAARHRVGKYMSYVSKVQRRFPGMPITCRPYDRKELVEGDIVADFWQFLGLASVPQTVSDTGTANMTPCRELAIALSEQAFASPPHRRKVIADIQETHPELFKSKDILDSSARQALQEEFRNENRALSEFCGRDVEALFNDQVDFEAESRPVADPKERAILTKLAEDTVRDTAARLHPDTV